MKKMVLVGLMSSLPVFSSEYIVKLKSPEAIKQLSMNKSIDEVRPLGVSFGTYVKINTNNKSVLENLKSDSQVVYVEENDYVYANPTNMMSVKTVNDPNFAQQWGLKNTGLNSGTIFVPGKAGEDINAISAWEVTKGNKDIKIAVIDTGVDYSYS